MFMYGVLGNQSRVQKTFDTFNMAGPELILCLIAVSLEPVLGEFCTAYSVWGPRVRTFHCSFGCCGSPYDQYCCNGSAGQIAGIVFGGIIGVAFASAFVCCCIKHANQRGRIIQPATTTSTYVGSHTTHANIFLIPSGHTTPAYSSSHPRAYSNVHTNSGHSEAWTHPHGQEAATPVPPAYSQPNLPQPPPYSRTGVTLPPPYSQLGVPPPTYSSSVRVHTYKPQTPKTT